MNPNEIFIDDSNFHLFAAHDDTVVPIVDGQKVARGHRPRDYTNTPLGSIPRCGPLPLPLIQRSEWSRLIKEQIASQSRLSDIVRRVNMPSLNQAQTNFCWANAPTNCVRIVRCIQNLPFIDLSPASVACRVNGFVNQGGWGADAMKKIIADGVDPIDMWPANAISRQYDTPASKERAKDFRVTEWFDLKPRSFEQLATCLLLGYPVAVGYNWWSHEVTAMDLVETAPDIFGVRIWNSWGDTWSDKGMGVLSEAKATPDDAVTANVVSMV